MNFEAVKTYIINRLENDLPKTLYYHTIHHTIDVLDAVELIAVAEKINNNNTLLLKTAALLHDSGFLIQYNSNELIGCQFAHKILPNFEYNNHDITIIDGMIMATKIPQTPKNHLEKIICDADLDYLGRDDFSSISKKLRKELKTHGKKFSENEWLIFEINFLEKHQYFTKTAQSLRNTKKSQHIQKLKNQLPTIINE